jgi:hypothetical protein
MGLFDRLFGSDQQDPPPPPRARSTDEIAVERYRYLLRTAPPETLEQVHAEAFAKLTDEQRRLVYQELAQSGEQPRGTDAASLAQAATRSEIRQPGSLERSFQGRGGQGPSFGAMVGSSLLGTVAGYVIGSALVSAFLPTDLGGADASADSATDTGDQGADAGADTNADTGADANPGDSGFGDFGGGGFGDFGGGDFGGGDF